MVWSNEITYTYYYYYYTVQTKIMAAPKHKASVSPEPLDVSYIKSNCFELSFLMDSKSDKPYFWK